MSKKTTAMENSVRNLVKQQPKYTLKEGDKETVRKLDCVGQTDKTEF